MESAQVNLLAKSQPAKKPADAGSRRYTTESAPPRPERRAEKGKGGDGRQLSPSARGLWVSPIVSGAADVCVDGAYARLPLPDFLHGTQNALPFAFLQFLLDAAGAVVNRNFIWRWRTARRIGLARSRGRRLGGGDAVYGVIAIFMIGAALGRGDWDTVERYRTNLYFESAADDPGRWSPSANSGRSACG